MTRREWPRTVLLDLASIAISAGLVLGSFFVHGTVGTGFPAAEVARAVADVVLIACLLRAVSGPRGRPLALWLLAGASLATVATGILRNPVLVHPAPGPWVDVGWAAAALLLGLAALHPSFDRLSRREPLSNALRVTSAIVLGLTSFVAPIMLTMHSFVAAVPDFDDSRLLSAAVLACGVALGTLVVIRFVLLLTRARFLAAAASITLGERDHMLERSELRYRHLVETVPAVVVVFRLETDAPAPVYVSPQSQAMLGVSPEQWLRNPEEITGRIHRHDVAHVRTEYARLVGGATTTHPEFRIIRPDGRQVWVRDVNGVVSEEPSGRYLQSMLVDITEYKHAEHERQQMEHELQLSQKLEAVGELAAGIAHEINTPIQFVGDTFAFLRGAFSDLLALSEVQSELRLAVENQTVSPELLGRAREAEDVADLEYLSERVPAAVERGVDGVSRVAAIVRAMRDFAHPPTTERYARGRRRGDERRADRGDERLQVRRRGGDRYRRTPRRDVQRRRDQPGVPEPDRQRRARDRRRRRRLRPRSARSRYARSETATMSSSRSPTPAAGSPPKSRRASSIRSSPPRRSVAGRAKASPWRAR